MEIVVPSLKKKKSTLSSSKRNSLNKNYCLQAVECSFKISLTYKKDSN